MLSRLVRAFLPRSKHLLIWWLQSLSTVILEPKKYTLIQVLSPFRLLLLLSAPWWVRLSKRLVRGSLVGGSGSFPLVGGAESCPSGGQGHDKGCVCQAVVCSACLQLGKLCSHPVGGLAWDVPALEPTGCWVGRSGWENGGLQEGLIQWNTSQNCLHQCLYPQGATATPCLCRRPSKTSRYVWPRLLWGHCFLPLDPGVPETFCVPSRSGVSVSPNPVEALLSNPPGFQSQILLRLLLPLPGHQIGEPNMGLRIFTPMGEFLWCNSFPVCRLSAQQLWEFDCNVIAPLLPSHCGFFVFRGWISVLVGSSVSFFLSVVFSS